MALEQFHLDGQVAVVTGAGKGVGQGCESPGGGRGNRRRHRPYGI
jgi:hypothetical protein